MQTSPLNLVFLVSSIPLEIERTSTSRYGWGSSLPDRCIMFIKLKC